MPSKTSRPNGSKNWRARCKRGTIEYYLGTYATREEAEEAERAFSRRFPKQHGHKRTAYKETDVEYMYGRI